MKKIQGKDHEAIQSYERWLSDQKITVPAVLEIGQICETEFFSIVRDSIELPNGTLGTHIRLSMSTEVSPGAACLVQFGESFVMLEHYRYATGRSHLECPRGFRMKGETPEETALREVREEIGLTLSKVLALGEMFVNTGFSDERVNLFYGRAESIGNLKEQMEEGISKIVCLERSEFFDAICNGSINDSFTLAAAARAKFMALI